MLALLLSILPFDGSRVPGPAEIAIWAAEDAAVAAENGRDTTGFRYIWIHRKDEQDCIDDARVIDLAPISMAISKSANIIKAHRVNSRLLRIDLLQLGVTPEKAARLILTWEKLRDLDHYLTASVNELETQFIEVTEDTAIKVESRVIRIAEPGERLTLNGVSPDPLWVQILVNGEKAFVPASRVKVPSKGEKRSIGPQCGQAGQELSRLVNSDIPIVRHDMLLRNVMHGDIVLRPIGEEGGLYYDFLQIDKAADGSNRTDLQTWLEAFGADFEQSQKLSGDVGSITVRSNVTGRSRASIAFRGRVGRPGESTGMVFGTFDSADGDDFDPNLDPTEDILGFRHKASEWIAPLANGTQAYGLFAGNADEQNQERQDFAPDDIVVDHTVPDPHGKRLVVGMCWRCHNTQEADDGFKPTKNDLAIILERGRDIISDPETADTIASRYTGNFERVLQRARDDHAAVVFRITRDPANRLEGMEPFEAFGRLTAIYHEYWYDTVTTEVALLDLGIVPEPEDNPADLFRDSLQVADIGEAAPVVYLASGIAVNRWQWESVYPEMILRAQGVRNEE